MVMRAVLLSLLLFQCGVLLVCSSSQDDAKERPVGRVVKLLRDMVSQLEHEGDTDEEVMGKMVCWCKVNERERAKTVESSKRRVDDLASEIESLTARVAELSVELASLERELVKAKNALDTAGALRTKDLAEFNKEEKEMLTAVSGIRSAGNVLSKHNAALITQKQERFLTGHQGVSPQVNSSADAVGDILDTVRVAGLAHMSLLSEILTPSQQKLLQHLSSADLLQKPGGESNEVFGILKAMQENFEDNLKKSQADEARDAKAYEDLKKAKELQIKTAEQRYDEKTDEEATSLVRIGRAKVDREESQEQLEADVKFLASVRTQCQDIDKVFAERKAMRAQEIAAVSKALDILGSDDSADLFDKSLNKPDFLQVRSQRHLGSSARGNLGALMLGVAQGKRITSQALLLQSKLVAEAAPPPSGGGGGAEFATKVMLDLKEKLVKQKEIDTEKREFCIEEIHENAREDNEQLHAKEALETRMEKLEVDMKQMKQDIRDLKDNVEELNIQMKRAGQNREQENHEFQTTLADQRASRELLQKALIVLKEVYGKPGTFLTQKQHLAQNTKSLSLLQTGKSRSIHVQPEEPVSSEWHEDDIPAWMLPSPAPNSGDESDLPGSEAMASAATDAGLVEESQTADDNSGMTAAPMPKFGEYKKKKQSGGALQLIEKIIFDTKQMEKEVVADEEYAQRDYQAFIKKTTELVELAQKDIISKKSGYAKGEEDTILMKDEHWAADKTYTLVHDTGLKLHAECDFLVKNFYDIIKGHDEEIAGLMDSVAILAGAEPS